MPLYLEDKLALGDALVDDSRGHIPLDEFPGEACVVYRHCQLIFLGVLLIAVVGTLCQLARDRMDIIPATVIIAESETRTRDRTVYSLHCIYQALWKCYIATIVHVSATRDVIMSAT